MAAEGKSRVLVIGATGYIGRLIVKASTKAGHPTFVLVRKSTAESVDPGKAKIIQDFKDAGVTIFHGDLFDHKSLLNAIKQADVVFSTVGTPQVPEQARIVAAIKEAGNVKRFLPSEYGNDVYRVHGVEPAKSTFEAKAIIRRLVESEGIPYTFISSNCVSDYFLPSLAQPGFNTTPPRDKVSIIGDGNPKAIFVSGADIVEYAIRAMDDPRAMNKILYVRPPANIISLNELVALWEKKIGKTLKRFYVTEEQILQQIQVSPFPMNVMLGIGHSVFVKGDQTNFEIQPSVGVEASQLYPDVKYTTVSEFLDAFV